MSNETTLAALLERNSELFTRYGAWAAAQTKLLAGTIDDPDSFNADGGKTGTLGYYPVENVSGQIIYVPSLARLQVIAAGGGDLSAVEALVDGAVAAKDAALAAKAEAESLVGAAATALQPGADAADAIKLGERTLSQIIAGLDGDQFELVSALGWSLARFARDGSLKTSAFAASSSGFAGRDFAVTYNDSHVARQTRSPLGWSIERLGLDGSLRTPALDLGPDRLATSAFAIVAIDKEGINVTTPIGWAIGIKTSDTSGLTTTILDSPSQGTITTPLGWKAGQPALAPYREIIQRATPANSVVWLWHSKGDQDSYSGHNNGGVTRRSDQGTNVWADYFLCGSTEPLFNASVGGESSSGLLGRLVDDVLAYNPAWCIFGVPACNDISGNRTAAVIIENCRAIVDALQNAGIKVLIHTDPTWYTGHTDLTAANIAKLDTVNRWVKSLPLTRSGVVAADVAKAFADPLSTTGAAKANFLKSDNIHPASKGARAGGKVKADALIAAGFPILDLLPRSVTETATFSAAHRQLARNPLFTSPGGTNSAGTTFTGTIPAGWSVSKSGTWGAGMASGVLEPRADGLGNDWVVTITGCGASGDYLTLSGPDCLSYVTEGDRIEAAAEISLTGMSKVTEHSLYAYAGSAKTSALERDDQANSGAGWGSNYYDQSDLIGGVMRTGIAVVSASPALCKGYFRVRFDAASGTATIRIGRFCVNKRD